MSALVVAAGAGVAAGALLQSATGFGFSLLAAPLVFAAVEPEQAVWLLTLLGSEVNVLTLATERRRPRPLWRSCAVMLAAAAPGALAGVAVLRSLSPPALQIAVTAGVLGTLATRHLAGRHVHVPAWAAGLAAGALTTSTTTSGPPMLLHLLGLGAEPARVRDTLPACFLGLSVLGAAALLATGSSTFPDTTLVAALLPAVAVGHLAGRRVFARLAAGGRYEPVLNATLVLAVLVGMVSVLA
jgi:uncharacterized protein